MATAMRKKSCKLMDDMDDDMSMSKKKDKKDCSLSKPGFKAVQKKIEDEGYSKKDAGAILADKTRHASPAAKKANPALKKVKMSADKKDIIQHEKKEIKTAKEGIKADKAVIKKAEMSKSKKK